MSYGLGKGNIYGREEEKNVLGQLFSVVHGMSEKSFVRCMAKRTFSLPYRNNHVEQFSLLLLKAVSLRPLVISKVNFLAKLFEINSICAFHL